jgi:hypothetical protein
MIVITLKCGSALPCGFNFDLGAAAPHREVIPRQHVEKYVGRVCISTEDVQWRLKHAALILGDIITLQFIF